VNDLSIRFNTQMKASNLGEMGQNALRQKEV
jgi:hypothetical protein